MNDKDIIQHDYDIKILINIINKFKLIDNHPRWVSYKDYILKNNQKYY